MSRLALDIELELGDFRLEIRDEWPLDGISAVFGPSGSGKTTLLRIIAGLETRARGRLAFDGQIWHDGTSRIKAHARRIGYVFQDGRLFSHLDVAANLRFPLRHSQPAPRIAFDDVVAALDLGPLLRRDTRTLSGGERQRVALARALLTNPQILLMDEPVSSLDIARKREIVRYIEELPARFGIPILYVTHDVNELVRLADDVIYFADGRVADRGSVPEVVERNALIAAAGSGQTGSVVELTVATHSERTTELRWGDESLRIPRIDTEPGKLIRLRIHSRDVVIACDRPRGLSIRNALHAEIADIDAASPAHCEIRLRVGGQPLRALITHEALEELGLAAGQSVFALIKSIAFEDYPLR